MLGGKAKLTGLHAATTLRNAAMPTSVFKTIFFTKIFETTSSFFTKKKKKPKVLEPEIFNANANHFPLSFISDLETIPEFS